MGTADGADIVHIAGVDLIRGSQLRQRCAWCGAVLIDHDLSMMAVPTSQLDENGEFRPATWPVGSLVAQIGESLRASWIVDHNDGDKLPPSCCGQLPFDVTGRGH